MNCAELDPYIEEFDSVILQRNPHLTDVQVEKEHKKSFATWLRYRVEQGFITDSRVQEIRDMVHGGRSGRVSTSVGRGSTRIGSTSPSTPVVTATGSASPSTSIVLVTRIASLSILGCLLDHAERPGDRFRLLPSSVTFPIPITNRAIIQRRMRRGLSYLDASHAGFLGTCSRDQRISLEHELFGSLLLRLISESRCGRPGTRQRRPQATEILLLGWIMTLCGLGGTIESPFVIVGLLDHGRSGHRRLNAIKQLFRRRMCILRHELERDPTFRELFDQTHKRKGTDDYVSESAARLLIVSASVDALLTFPITKIDFPSKNDSARNRGHLVGRDSLFLFWIFGKESV
ncbi:hypothetical protein Taro_040606 [Colocasia esculenta]|uniref:Uncharacterized protein n=1 Tax=Colocasia esculenta TaxID=4460 RepID=A0A843WDM2_COLES|nr:hypothetical protein [Colocasia esculenta]